MYYTCLFAGNVVLLIDEVHTLVGSGSVGRGGSAGAGLDIANLLKPALARGDLQVTIVHFQFQACFSERVVLTARHSQLAKACIGKGRSSGDDCAF